MSSWSYYNEIDEYAAAWLRNLIRAGHIAPGEVDTRSIEDVRPNDLRGFTQCHFFAGIGVWSLALRKAGWSDTRPVWTGSCPCQPFSSAGQGAGFADERHLWPAFHHLIKECRPAAVLGEQVASKDSDPWIDLVHTDLEALGYAFGAIPFPASSVGAPHIRDRLYWVGYAGQYDDPGEVKAAHPGHPETNRPASQLGRPSVPLGGLADADGNGSLDGFNRAHGRTTETTPKRGPTGGLADNHSDRCSAIPEPGKHCAEHHAESRGAACPRPGPTNGHWANADWLLCRDGKWRPVEPGTFPLAHGAAARVGRLRAYGNAICAKAAQVFIECVMDCAP